MIMKNQVEFIKNHTLPQIWNKIRYKMSMHDMHAKTYLRYDPIQLIVLITCKCNQKCNFCLQSSPKVNDLLKYPDISFDNFKRIVNKFRRAVYLDLTGGEPFLHNSIFKMIEYGCMRKMEVTINTNGTVISDKIDRIISSSTSTLSISLDAYNSSGYRKMHGASEKVFNGVIQNIIKLVEKRNRFNKKLKLQITHICTKENYKWIPDMVLLAQELGVDVVMFRNLLPWDLPGFLEDQCLYNDDSDVIEVIKSVDNLKPKLVVVMPKLLDRGVAERACRNPFFSLQVDSEGNVSTCCRMVPQSKYGNIFLDSNVWNNCSFQRLRKALIDKSLPLPQFCRTCHSIVP